MIVKLENISLELIYDFVEHGRIDNAPEELVRYLELMDKVRGMRLRFDKYGSKEIIIKHLMKVEDLSRYLANKIYNNAIAYFYSDYEISKEAWRNVYAEMLEKVIHFSILQMKDVSDADRVSKIIERAAHMRQLNKEDEKEIPEEFFQKPWKLYAMDSEMLGLPPINRSELTRQIEELPEVPEKVKDQLKREAALLPINIFPEEHEDARKS